MSQRTYKIKHSDSRSIILEIVIGILILVLLLGTIAISPSRGASPPVQQEVQLHSPVLDFSRLTPTGVEEEWTFFPSKDSFLSSAFPNNN